MDERNEHYKLVCDAKSIVKINCSNNIRQF